MTEEISVVIQCCWTTDLKTTHGSGSWGIGTSTATSWTAHSIYSSPITLARPKHGKAEQSLVCPKCANKLILNINSIEQKKHAEDRKRRFDIPGVACFILMCLDGILILWSLLGKPPITLSYTAMSTIFIGALIVIKVIDKIEGKYVDSEFWLEEEEQKEYRHIIWDSEYAQYLIGKEDITKANIYHDPKVKRFFDNTIEAIKAGKPVGIENRGKDTTYIYLLAGNNPFLHESLKLLLKMTPLLPDEYLVNHYDVPHHLLCGYVLTNHRLFLTTIGSGGDEVKDIFLKDIAHYEIKSQRLVITQRGGQIHNCASFQSGLNKSFKEDFDNLNYYIAL